MLNVRPSGYEPGPTRRSWLVTVSRSASELRYIPFVSLSRTWSLLDPTGRSFAVIRAGIGGSPNRPPRANRRVQLQPRVGLVEGHERARRTPEIAPQAEVPVDTLSTERHIGGLAGCVHRNPRVPAVADPVFAEPSAPRTGPLAWIEPLVHWFTESTHEVAIAGRANVNRWYEAFPDPEGKLARRLRSEMDSEHLGALDELFVHQLLAQRWTDVRYEENGEGPDFRIYDSGRYLAGMEVVSLFEREDWDAQQRRWRRVADELNEQIRPTAGYMLGLEFDHDTNAAPTTRNFVAFLLRQLAELPDPEEFRDLDHTHWPLAEYREPPVRIRVRFIPMLGDPSSRFDPEIRIVAMGPSMGGEVNTAKRIRQRVNDKAGGRYQIDTAPFLVAVALHDLFQNDHEIETSMYGTQAVQMSGTVQVAAQIVRYNNGVFGADGQSPEGKNRRLSAVAFLQRLLPSQPQSAEVSVLVNPFASHIWPPEVLPATRWFGEVGSTDTELTYAWRDFPPRNGAPFGVSRSWSVADTTYHPSYTASFISSQRAAGSRTPRP